MTGEFVKRVNLSDGIVDDIHIETIEFNSDRKSVEKVARLALGASSFDIDKLYDDNRGEKENFKFITDYSQIIETNIILSWKDK